MVPQGDGTSSFKLQLNKEAFNSLSPTDQAIWDQLPQSAKETILKSRKPTPYNAQRPPAAMRPPVSDRRVNFASSAANTSHESSHDAYPERTDGILGN